MPVNMIEQNDDDAKRHREIDNYMAKRVVCVWAQTQRDIACICVSVRHMKHMSNHAAAVQRVQVS